MMFPLPRLETAAIRRFLTDPWLWAVLAITALAAFLRLYRLTEIPPGILGDEGLMGINARRILDEGWIGAYVPVGPGVNSGTMYLMALFIGILGNTVLAIRLPMALMGVATVPLAYLAFREMVGKPTALIAAYILAVSLWHIQLSRIAFPQVAWPMMEMATLAALFWAFRTRRAVLFGLAGLLLGLGVHSYNAYPLFPAGLYLFFVWVFIRGQPMSRSELLRNVVFFTVAAVIGALPLIREALDSSSLLRVDDARTATLIINSPAYQEADIFGRVEVVASRAWEYILALTWSTNRDSVVRLGITPVLDGFTVVLGLLGLAYMAINWRRPAHVLVMLMILTLAMGAVLTSIGMFRRSFGVVPFISLAAALPLALVWEQSQKLRAVRRWALIGAIVVILGLIAQVNLVRYFDTFANSPATWGGFNEGLTKASVHVADLPSEPYIYLYSGRRAFGYQTQKYLLPDRPGEDRSLEFGQFSLEADRTKDVVFVFLDPYLDLLPQVVVLHPGGIAHEERDAAGKLLFRAYYLPRQAAGSQPPAEAGLAGRDAVRIYTWP